MNWHKMTKQLLEMSQEDDEDMNEPDLHTILDYLAIIGISEASDKYLESIRK